MSAAAARLTFLVAPAAVVAACAVLAAGADAHGWDRHCGDQHRPGAGWGNVKAYNTGCRVARRVARHYWNSWKDDGKGDRRFRGWRCHDRHVAEELWRGSCVRDRNRHQHVKFEFGF